MNYYVRDGEKTEGPFTLVQLQAEVQSGRIAPSALVQSEGMLEWRPASEVLGNISVAPPSVAAPAPAAAPPVFHHQVEGVQPPPNLHWTLVIVLGFMTCGLFQMAWAIVLANWARKLERSNLPLVAVSIYPVGIFAAIIAALSGHGLLARLIGLGAAILYLLGVFTIKQAMEAYYTTKEKMGLSLSAFMT